VARGSDASILVSNRAILWVLLGVGAGAVFGAAGAFSSDASNLRRAVGNALLPGVFLAEASHQVIRQSTTDADGRPDDLLAFAGLLAILAVVALVWRLHGRAAAEVARTIGMTAAVAAIGGLAYAVLTG